AAGTTPALRDPEKKSQSQSQDTTVDGQEDKTVVSPVDAHDRPAWFDAAIDTVEFNCGEKLDRPAAWIRYSADRKVKARPMSAIDAQRWLVTVDHREAKRLGSERLYARPIPAASNRPAVPTRRGGRRHEPAREADPARRSSKAAPRRDPRDGPRA